MWGIDGALALPVLVIGLAFLGLVGARARASLAAGGDPRALAALPGAHGANAFFSVLVPAVTCFAVLSLIRLTGQRQGIETLSAATAFWLVLAVALLGGVGAILRSTIGFRARIASEAWIRALLIAASSVAILTTLGIVASMLFEAMQFFRQYDWRDFFLSADWSPNFRGDSALGILPLLWGTLYVSFIALLLAVPVGLLAAIYLSDYAGPRMRAIAKPLIEILAGIPTIVYGLFALITIGPLLRDYFAQPLGRR